MEKGQEGCIAKVSKMERDGTICIFLRRREFFVLEAYMKEHQAEIKKGNTFIAHRGLLGISRDLMDIESHNAQQAKLLWEYFQTIDSAEEIDIFAMYQLFVLGWNGELSDDHPFYKAFANCTAQMFLLMLETLDVLLGRKTIDDNSLLLNDDKTLWQNLASCRCWGKMRWEE